MCMADDGEPTRVSVTVNRKARKQHKCDECRRTIEPGEPYESTSGISGDGDPFRHKVCQHCLVGVAWLNKNCNGYVMGMVGEDLNEHAADYARHDLLALVTGIQDGWKGRGIPELPRALQVGDARVQ